MEIPRSISISRLTALFLLILLTAAATGIGKAQGPIAAVKPQSGKELQSLAPSYWLELSMRGGAVVDGENFRDVLFRNIRNGWNCQSVLNYRVAISNKPLTIRRVAFRDKNMSTPEGCRALLNTQAAPPELNLVILLYFDENQPLWRSISGKADVDILNLKDKSGTNADIKGTADVKWKLDIFTVSAQTVTNEKLTDKTIYKNTVYQFPLSSNIPLFGNNRGGAFIETKDLFSTNERDSKSAFMGGFGYQVGLLSSWTLPLKIEQQMTGNQVATNLSAVTTAQVSGVLPWTNKLTPPDTKRDDASKGSLDDDQLQKIFFDLPALDQTPAITVALPYTHRINQVLASNSTPLPTNDFAVNPSIALTGERLFESDTYKSCEERKVPRFSTQWEGNWAFYYLPLEKTSKGTQRAEGSGDVSILIPISNFQVIPGLTLDAKTQANVMQLRIKWQDTVSPTNNYVRTRGWVFGLEVILKK